MPVVKGKFRRMHCVPQDGAYQCVCQCGFTCAAKHPHAAHGCRDLITPNPPLSLMQKAKNFARAAIGHVAAGMPRASDEEIERRFAICQGCEFYKNASCTKCGCPISRDKRFISKLAWADQSCPVGKWGNGK